MESTTLPLPLPSPTREYEIRWFRGGCVIRREDRCDVMVGGTLIGSFDPRSRDLGPRNVLMVSLAQEPRMHLGQLASAFDVSAELLRLLRRRAEKEGMRSLFTRARGGSEPKVTPALRRKLERMFSEGVGVTEAHRRISKRHDISAGTVWNVRQAWKEKTAEEGSPVPSQAPAQPAAQEREDAASSVGELASEAESQDREVAAEVVTPLAPAEVRKGAMVQHLGAWLMMAMVARFGLHERMAAMWESSKGSARLRVIVDAVIAALAIGQRCVEGVRRLRTPTGALLLRSNHVPTASWVRRVLHRFASAQDDIGATLQIEMARSYVEAAQGDDLAVFYVDNHLRPYSGKQVIRRGWRMQDKRVVPGITDYYVHDEDGRPIFRVDCPSHDSLSQWLLPVGSRLRDDLGAGERVLLAFDRAGAYPEQMANLREAGVEFVTYERRPFPILAATAFDRELDLDGEKVGLHETRLKNLGAGRGRVRRIVLRMEDGDQVNLLAVSKEPADRLVSVMAGRWCQENAFKHGKERWGINQLDARKVEAYAPETVIPNPARRRMDRALRLARISEGLARRELARRKPDDPRRARYEEDLEEALTQQIHIEMLRPFTPTHAPLAETELAGKLVYHRANYKLVLDAIRIACANAESELAGELAPHLARPAEAKKVIANLLAAPGDIVVGKANITVKLYPATTPDEGRGLKELLAVVNRWSLKIPGDPRQRPLRFQLSDEVAV